MATDSTGMKLLAQRQNPTSPPVQWDRCLWELKSTAHRADGQTSDRVGLVNLSCMSNSISADLSQLVSGQFKMLNRQQSQSHRRWKLLVGIMASSQKPAWCVFECYYISSSGRNTRSGQHWTVKSGLMESLDGMLGVEPPQGCHGSLDFNPALKTGWN